MLLRINTGMSDTENSPKTEADEKPPSIFQLIDQLEEVAEKLLAG
jgi:hypothetical protein